nr:hypothetical protein Q903MT_gene322 [Picea sitchensis]
MDGSSTYPYLDLLCQTPSTMGGVPLQTPYSTQEGRKEGQRKRNLTILGSYLGPMERN